MAVSFATGDQSSCHVLMRLVRAAGCGTVGRSAQCAALLLVAGSVAETICPNVAINFSVDPTSIESTRGQGCPGHSGSGVDGSAFWREDLLAQRHRILFPADMLPRALSY